MVVPGLPGLPGLPPDVVLPIGPKRMLENTTREFACWLSTVLGSPELGPHVPRYEPGLVLPSGKAVASSHFIPEAYLRRVGPY